MSESTEEYLEAIYALTQDHAMATTTAISRRLRIAPASVTEMLKKLAAKELVFYSPRRGVALTAKGMEIGEAMARKHRLLEFFLHDSLHVRIDKVHDEACAMEHALSDETERALCRALRSPARCPDDGELIPACNLALASCEECGGQAGDASTPIGKRRARVFPISRLREDEGGTVVFVRGDTEMLTKMRDKGLAPGMRIQVRRVSPVEQSVQVTVNGTPVTLEDDIASNVFVRNANETKVLDAEIGL